MAPLKITRTKWNVYICHLEFNDLFSDTSFAMYIGRLSGVMDDRGKYIYISLEEMKAVADYIKRQGRVSISL